MPRLSVLMSAYRAEATVRSAMVSALRAMPRDSELVVAIDGPDQQATADAVDSVRDPRVKTMPSEVNLGVGGEAIRLFEATDSDFVARLDADDICFPWRFKVSLPRLKDVEYVFTSAVRFERGRAPRLSYPLGLNPRETTTALLFTTPLFHSSVTAKRSAMASAGGYKDIRFGEDTELWLRAAGLGQRIEKLALACIAYRLSPGQVSRNHLGDAAFMSAPDFVRSYQSVAQRLNVPTFYQTNGVIRPRIDDPLKQQLLRSCRSPQRRYVKRQMAIANEFVS